MITMWEEATVSLPRRGPPWDFAAPPIKAPRGKAARGGDDRLDPVGTLAEAAYRRGLADVDALLEQPPAQA